MPSVRAAGPRPAFGIGLRLSAEAAGALARPDTMAELKHFLAREDLYMFTLNGFPYGTFHGKRVKEDVYLPDWQDSSAWSTPICLPTCWPSCCRTNRTDRQRQHGAGRIQAERRHAGDGARIIDLLLIMSRTWCG